MLSTQKRIVLNIYLMSRPVFRNPAGNLGLQLGSVALRYDGILSRRTSGGVAPPNGLSGLVGDAEQLETHIAKEERLAYLEAVLFLSRQPLQSRKLAKLARLNDGTEARTLIKILNESYDATDRAFRVEEIAGGYQMRTRRQFSSWLRRMAEAPAEIRMSSPAMETLAVVAYRQPVMRAEIETIRGVQCGEILRQLMERGVVRIAGRADELGRPFLYGTTRNFLEVFGLRSLDELPRASMLRASAGSGNDLVEVSEHDLAKEEESAVTASDAVDESCDVSQLKEVENISNLEEDDDIDDLEEDDDIDDLEEDDDLDEDDTTEDDSDEDDGFNDEEWEEVEDDADPDSDSEEEEEEWDDEEDWDDEDWDEDGDEEDPNDQTDD